MVLGNITPCKPLSTMITQKLIYTCRWLGSHMDVNGFNLDGLLPHWQLCWSYKRCRVRLQDWLNSEGEFSIAFKVNYMSEDLLPVTVTSHYYCRRSLLDHFKMYFRLWKLYPMFMWQFVDKGDNYILWINVDSTLKFCLTSAFTVQLCILKVFAVYITLMAIYHLGTFEMTARLN